MAVRTLGASFAAGVGYELQRKNNFEFSVPGVADNDRLLTLSVISCALPTETNDVITVNYGNTNVKVAGVFNTEGGNLTVRDFLQKDMEKAIDDWRSSVYNKDTDAIGFAADYKKQARVVQYAPDGTYERTWKLIGVWPSQVSYGDLSNTDGNPKEIQITLQYDKAILQRS